MSWGEETWGLDPWGCVEIAPPLGAVLTLVRTDVIARDLILVEFNEPLRIDDVLRNPDSWTVTPDGSGMAVAVKSVRPGLSAKGTRQVYLEVTQFTVGETYTVTASTDLINVENESLTLANNTGKFKGRTTKVDSIIKGRPVMYDTSVGSSLRQLINAIGREDDLIGGSRDDRLP